jgi:hypothetical protein
MSQARTKEEIPMIGCGVEIKRTTPGGRKISYKCGTFVGGRKVLCERCERVAEREYPQGWRGYPGDVCEHGVYVGGCGVDHICPRCEMEG